MPGRGAVVCGGASENVQAKGGGGIPKIEGGRGHAGICTGLRVRALIPRCLRESVCVCVGGGGG